MTTVLNTTTGPILLLSLTLREQFPDTVTVLPFLFTFPFFRTSKILIKKTVSNKTLSSVPTVVPKVLSQFDATETQSITAWTLPVFKFVVLTFENKTSS